MVAQGDPKVYGPVQHALLDLLLREGLRREREVGEALHHEDRKGEQWRRRDRGHAHGPPPARHGPQLVGELALDEQHLARVAKDLVACGVEFDALALAVEERTAQL